MLGISSTTFLVSCDQGDVEYRMDIDLEYINLSVYEVGFEINKDIYSSEVSSIVLLPNSKSETFTYEYEGVEEDINPQTCCNEFLSGVYSMSLLEGTIKTLIVNDSLCVEHFNEKSVIIKNYEITELSDRHYKYAYTFTNGDFENTIKCEQ